MAIIALRSTTASLQAVVVAMSMLLASSLVLRLLSAAAVRALGVTAFKIARRSTCVIRTTSRAVLLQRARLLSRMERTLRIVHAIRVTQVKERSAIMSTSAKLTMVIARSTRCALARGRELRVANAKRVTRAPARSARLCHCSALMRRRPRSGVIPSMVSASRPINVTPLASLSASACMVSRVMASGAWK